MSDTYNVVITGQIIDGHEVDQVIESVAKIFKLPMTRAKALFNGQKRTIKKSTDHKTAFKFKATLEKAGAGVELKRVVSETKSLDSLSSVPMEKKKSEEVFKKNSTPVSKINSVSSTQVENQHNPGLDEPDLDDPDLDNSLRIVAFFAAAGAAAAGAFIWLQIAIAFEMELGFIAWIIGSVIGFSVLLTESYGKNAGILSGIFALLSILGGQYLVYDHFSYGAESVFELMIQEFNFISAIFLVLGVSTAYKLGSGLDVD